MFTFHLYMKLLEVLLQRDFRLEVLTEYCVQAKLWFLLNTRDY